MVYFDPKDKYDLVRIARPPMGKAPRKRASFCIKPDQNRGGAPHHYVIASLPTIHLLRHKAG